MIESAIIVWYPNAEEEILSATTEARIKVAERIVDEAQQHAPVRTGAFRDGLHVEISGAEVDIVDDDPAAFFIEYGTIDTPPAGVITEAAENEGEYHGKRPGK